MKASAIRPILTHFLVSYLIVLLLPLSLCVVLYFQALGITERETIASNMAMLRQGRDLVDRMLDETKSEAIRLAGNPQLNSLLYVDREALDKEWYKAYDAFKSVASFSTINGSDNSFFLYFAMPDVFVTSGAVYKDRELFLHEVYGENFDPVSWRKSIGDSYFSGNVLPAVPMTIRGINRRYIAYLQSMPIASFMNKYFGIIAILIDEEKFHQPFANLPIGDKGFFLITDERGSTISSIGTAPDRIDASDSLQRRAGSSIRKIGDIRMFVSSVDSAKYGWQYTVALPYREVMKKVEGLRVWTFVIIAAISLASLIIAVYSSYRKSVPLFHILNLIKGEKAPPISTRRRQKEYDWFEKPLNDLIANSEDIRRRLEEQRPLLRAAFFQKLITGGFSSKEEIEAVGKRIDVRFGTRPYAVMLFRIHWNAELPFSESSFEVVDFDSLEKARAILRTAIQSVMSEFDYAHDLDHEHILLFLEESDQDRDNVVVSGIQGEIPGPLINAIDIGIGSAYRATTAMDRSYAEAVKALDYVVRRESEETPAVMHFKDIPRSNGDSYFYPIDAEVRILNLVANGRTEELKNALTEIREENFVKRTPSPELMDTLLNELDATVVKASMAIVNPDAGPQNDQPRKERKKDGSYDDRFNETAAALLALCAASASRKRKGASKIVERIEEYVQENFADSTLSLTSIADKFRMNESYLSFIFKDHSGENLSDRIERRRIDAAQALLDRGEININEIAYAIGYNGDQSFRRAFKRVTGMSPSRYRNR